MDFDGRPFIDGLPGCLIEHKNEARMEIQYKNGSRLLLAGSNNYDSLMGTNPVSIIYSEFALHHPLARQHLQPILIQNKGLEIIQSTTRGKNHFYDAYEMARDNSTYHVEYLTVEDTRNNEGNRIITDDDIAEARRRGMSEEMVRQEFYCDFDVGNLGAYFTREMFQMEHERRICNVSANPNLPLHTCWDLGGTDATAGWFFQLEGQYINLVYFIQDTGFGLKHYLDQAEQYRRSVGCQWGNHFMPHDITQKHQGWEQAESRLNIARQHGWFFQVVPKVNFEDGIESLRYVFQILRADKMNCAVGLRALREYQRLYDDLKMCFRGKPLDNWATHPVDALRYLAVNYRRLYQNTGYTSKYETSL